MALSNRDRQTRYRQRARTAKRSIFGMANALEGAINRTEQAMALIRQHGHGPNDGSAVGVWLAEQEVWIETNRRALEAVKRELGLLHQPD
jgi:hypothetical protein